ncbi:hypothetical protein PQQ51_30850 [Paraburkholderia xenovorans]|uniref:hypothetical protein n=1 Tax=Paraburkholderia xenovorans TaxID=36873 RepID=UPI0038BC5B30
MFHFDVQGAVAKSTHSGLPWLLYLHRELGEKVHFWPFDGWDIAPGRSAIVEACPSWLNPNQTAAWRTKLNHQTDLPMR